MGPRTCHRFSGSRYNEEVKSFRSSLALALSTALIVLSPGASAWAEAGAIARLDAGALGGADTAAVAAGRGVPAEPAMTVIPPDGIGALTPAFAATSVLAPAAPAPADPVTASAAQPEAVAPAVKFAASMSAYFAKPNQAAPQPSTPDSPSVDDAAAESGRSFDFTARRSPPSDAAGVYAAAVGGPRRFLAKFGRTGFDAKAASYFGDSTAVDAGRASFNPLTWSRHFDFHESLVRPLTALIVSHGTFILGGGKPVPFDEGRFESGSREMAGIAAAGPAVNAILAVVGKAALIGAVACGLGPLPIGVLHGFVLFNGLLAIFNLIPARTLDGSHLLAYWAPKFSAGLERAYRPMDAFFAAAADGFRTRSRRLETRPLAFKAVGKIEEEIREAGFFFPQFAAAISLAICVDWPGAIVPVLAVLGLTIGAVRAATYKREETAVIAQYRLLTDRVAADRRAKEAFMRKAAPQDGNWRDELLEFHEKYVEPALAAHRADLNAFVSAHPSAPYEAAGPWGRMWMQFRGSN